MPTFHRKYFSVLIGLLTISISACVYVPPLQSRFTEEKRGEIEVGTSTRQDVVALLGEPDLLNERDTAIYQEQLGRGGFVLLPIAYGSGLGYMPVPGRKFRVLIQFDQDGVVNRYDIEEATYDSLGQSEPVDIGSQNSWRDERKHLFTPKAEHWFGTEASVGISSLRFSPDGETLAAGGVKLVGGHLSTKRLWLKNIGNGTERIIEVDSYRDAVFSPDLTKVALVSRRTKLLDLDVEKVIIELPKDPALAVAFNARSDLLAAGGKKGKIALWNTKSGVQSNVIEAHDGPVTSLCFSDDGKLLVSAGDRSVRFWDVASSTRAGPVLVSNSGLIRLSPTGNILALVTLSHIELWRLELDPSQPQRIRNAQLLDAFLLPYLEMEHDSFKRYSMAFSPDGRYLAVSNGGLIVVDVDKQELVRRIVPESPFNDWDGPPDDLVLGVTFAPDGKFLAKATRGGIYILPINSETTP